MEKDGTSRLYAMDGEGHLYLEWPDGPSDVPLPSKAAREVILRADVQLVSVIYGEVGEWVVIYSGTHTIPEAEKVFPMQGSGLDRYANLAKAVEDLLGKTGVTILFG